SDLLFDGFETINLGTLDPTVPQLLIDGAANVVLRHGIVAAQTSGTYQAIIGSGSNTVTSLLVDTCRFEGISSGVTALNCNTVVRPVIRGNSFEASGATGQAIRLGSGTS